MLYAVLAALVNSFIAVLIKLCAEVPNEIMVFFRFFIGFLILLPFYIQKKIKVSRLHFSKHLFRSVLGLFSIYFYYFAIKKIPLANAMALSNTMPLFTPLVLLVWLRLIVSKQKLAAVAIGFFGVVLMLNPTQLTFEWGSFAALGTGLFASIAFVGIRQLSKIESKSAILFCYFTVVSFVSFIPCIYSWQPIVDLKIWIYLVLMGLLGILFQSLMTLGLSMAPSSKTGLATYLTVVFGGLLGWGIWDEVPRFWGTMGMLLTIAGGCLAVVDRTRSRQL